MRPVEYPSQERLKELFYYKDGSLYWANPPTRGHHKLGSSAGCTDGTSGYRYIKVDGVHCREHRLIFLLHHGYLPPNIDHINRNKTDNRIENLRPSSESQNNMNRPKMKNNTSGITGVTWSKRKKKWIATVRSKGELLYHKMFSNFNDAALARLTAEKVHFGEFAPQRFYLEKFKTIDLLTTWGPL